MATRSQDIRALAAEFATRELLIYPVRHHSPACAWRLQRLFDERPPSKVLVEGPRNFSPLIPLLVHAEAKMPLAVYTYAVERGESADDVKRRAAYYPFCDYSPELVALREAAARGIPSAFIDLDFAEQCQVSADEDSAESVSLLDERHFKRSRFLQALAEQQGCRSDEELWEHLFEVPAANRSLEEHLASLAAYCQLARADATEPELRADGTLQREAEMAWHVREALAARKPDEGPVLVVVGGFHAVVMPALLRSNPPRPSISRSRITDEAAALIRYSFDRLDRLNGYSAGMTSPAWHQWLWERMQARAKAGVDAGPRARLESVLAVTFEIADALRTRNVQIPVPALTAAYEQTLRLAELRGRAAPVREDVLDAITSCFVKGSIESEGVVVLETAHRILSGHAVGKVPPGASRPPLVKDFEYRARRQRLRIDDSDPRRSVLDIYRRQDHRLTSRLFHGLLLLGVPIGFRSAGPDFVSGVGLERLQEHWEYSYSAAVEAALVEASIYGVTVPLAVASKFAERLQKIESGDEPRDARIAAGLTVQACVLGLHDHLDRVLGGVRDAIGVDAEFESVASAVFTLGLLWESREPLEARDVAALPELIQAAYERAIYLGLSLQGSKAQDERSLLQALTRLRELLVSAAGRTLDASLYWDLVHRLRTQHDSPLVRGGAAGIAYTGGYLSEEELGAAVAGHLSGLAQPKEAVGFLRGLLYCAREAAWQQPTLLRVLDNLLAKWDEQTFVGALPELRLAFAEMTPNETDRIALRVANLHGADTLGPLVRYDLSDEQVQGHLLLSQAAREVLQADGLAGWLA
jgi:hypothetical protein